MMAFNGERRQMTLSDAGARHRSAEGDRAARAAYAGCAGLYRERRQALSPRAQGTDAWPAPISARTRSRPWRSRCASGLPRSSARPARRRARPRRHRDGGACLAAALCRGGAGGGLPPPRLLHRAGPRPAGGAPRSGARRYLARLDPVAQTPHTSRRSASCGSDRSPRAPTASPSSIRRRRKASARSRCR